jgi:aminotransferase
MMDGRLMPALSKVVEQAEEAMSIKFNTMVYELQRQGRKVIVMSLGEAFFDIPLFPMDDLPFPEIYHYSHSRGIPELREKLSSYYREHYGVAVDPEQEILVTAGSKAAIHMTLMSILDPGDEVLLPEPAWVSFKEQVKLCYATPVGIPWDVGPDAFEEFITPRSKAIVLNTPHNPRGYIYSRKDLEQLLALAEEHDLWLLSDEAYSDFVVDDSFVSLGSLDKEKERSVVFNSASKNYGISGWRIGYVIARAHLVDQVLKVNQHLITCPPTILSYYLTRYFDRILEITKPQIRSVLQRRTALISEMDALGLSHLPGAATFYVFVSIEPSRLGSEEFCTRLLRQDLVSTVPGIGYGASCDRFIRVSVGTATLDENRHGLERIRGLIDRTS